MAMSIGTSTSVDTSSPVSAPSRSSEDAPSSAPAEEAPAAAPADSASVSSEAAESDNGSEGAVAGLGSSFGAPAQAEPAAAEPAAATEPSTAKPAAADTPAAAEPSTETPAAAGPADQADRQADARRVAAEAEAAEERATPGERAVAEARKFEGLKSPDLKGKVPTFEAVGGKTNNCADFASSFLVNQGQLKQHQINVRAMKQALPDEGYRKIKASEAQPGDLAFSGTTPRRNSHVQLVSSAGARNTIGSNNNNPVTGAKTPGRQAIYERSNVNPANLEVWTRRPADVQVASR